MDRKWLGQGVGVGVLVEEMMGVGPWRGRGSVCGERWGWWKRGQLIAPGDVGPHVLGQNGGKGGNGQRGVLCIAFGDRRGSFWGHRGRGLGWY